MKWCTLIYLCLNSVWVFSLKITMKHLLFLKCGILAFIQHIFIPYVPTPCAKQLEIQGWTGTSSFKALQDDRVETENPRVEGCVIRAGVDECQWRLWQYQVGRTFQDRISHITNVSVSVMTALISADIHEEISAISNRTALQFFLQLLV